MLNKRNKLKHFNTNSTKKLCMRKSRKKTIIPRECKGTIFIPREYWWKRHTLLPGITTTITTHYCNAT